MKLGLGATLAVACAAVLAAPRSARAAQCGCGVGGFHIHGTLPASSSPAAPQRAAAAAQLLQPINTPTQNLGAFQIVIVPGAGLAANPSAVAAFNRAADQWEARISDPITVTVNADFATFANPNTIGSTSPVGLQGQYDFVRGQLITDANAQPPALANGITNSLPTNAQFTATLPAGRSFVTDVGGADPSQKFIGASKANFKAMGFTGLDVSFGASDGTITFNQAFTFDFDRSDGVTPGQTDFETTAAHEIGHLLGFTSNVDSINGTQMTNGSNAVIPTVLDLYRFDRAGANNPATVGEFTIEPRNLTPGADTVFDDVTSEFRMSSGLNTLQFPGAVGTDGRQASHWKDDALTGTYVGMMDPTLGPGVFQSLTEADFRALDLIGWDVQVPEPSALALAAAMLAPFARRRRRV